MKRVLSGIAASGALAAGCTPSNEAAPQPLQTHPTTPVEQTVRYSCDPRLDNNYLKGHTPAEVKAEEKLDYTVVVSTLGDLTIRYERDCGTEVRGPESAAYHLGPLLTSSFCEGKRVGIFGGNLRDENAASSPDERISSDLIHQTHQLEKLLAASRMCAEHVIEPLGEIAPAYRAS